MSDPNLVIRGSFEGSDEWDGLGCASVEGDALNIAGAMGRELLIPADRVGRIRFARFAASSTTRGSWETKIWPRTGDKPLLILATPEQAGQYGVVMRAFAARIAEHDGLDRIMRGPDLGTAIVNFILSGCSILAVAILCLVFAILDGTWWMWLLAIAALAAAALAIASLLRRHWPRRVGSLEALADVLPT